MGVTYNVNSLRKALASGPLVSLLEWKTIQLAHISHRYFATVAHLKHLCTHTHVSIYTCTHTHTYSVEEGEGVPWPFAVPVFDIWGADVGLCVSVATADGNIRALPWLSELPLSSFPSLFSPAVSGSIASLCLLSVCLCLRLTVVPWRDCYFVCLFSHFPKGNDLFIQNNWSYFSLFLLCCRCIWQLFSFTEWEGLVSRHSDCGTCWHQRCKVLLHTSDRPRHKIYHCL